MHVQVATTPSLCDVIIDATSFCCSKGMADAVFVDVIHTACADSAIIKTHIIKSIPNIRPGIHRRSLMNTTCILPSLTRSSTWEVVPSLKIDVLCYDLRIEC